VHGANRHCPRTALPRRAARAFSLVELLVVIAVIGLLIAAIVGIANVAIHNQKVRNTRAIMKNVTLAIDQFKEEDPLRLIYNGKNPTFGPYPPYQLAGDRTNPSSVAGVLDPNGWADLGVRLTRDLSGQTPPPPEPNVYVDIEQGNANDDIRALYAYLTLYAPGALAQVPESAKKALPDRLGGPSEMVNPTGSGTNPPGTGALDVFGIYDAWDVPLDYLLYVKLEWGVRANGTVGVKIKDRVPVLRSRGIPRDVYDVQQNDPQAPPDPSNWIFSTEFPSPPADVAWDTGVFNTGGGSTANGWARAVGIGPPPANREDYGYRPDQDPGP
jgi:prepilin-type N-terminal cleavage/methylation domain-containing protein